MFKNKIVKQYLSETSSTEESDVSLIFKKNINGLSPGVHQVQLILKLSKYISTFNIFQNYLNTRNTGIHTHTEILNLKINIYPKY